MNLTEALATAAAEYAAENPEAPPGALYVQRYTDGEWWAAFRLRDDMDGEMIRWTSGDDAADHYTAARDGFDNAWADLVEDINQSWEEEWDEEA